MKKVFILIFIFTFAGIINAQPGPPNQQRGRGHMRHHRLERLEKIKLMEVLNLDEETSIRFFNRRDNFRDEQRKLIHQKENLVDELNDAIHNDSEDYNYKETMKKIFNIDEEIVKRREKFLDSLKDILNEKQIATLVVFEARFMREIKKYLMDKDHD